MKDIYNLCSVTFFFSSRRRHTILQGDWSSDVCSSDLKTTELDDSRVRVDVEVPAEALESALRSAAADLGREIRVPGFRTGKVPPDVVLRQVGREAVMDEALRRGLPAWYEEAVADAGITTVCDPQLDLSDLPEKGSPLAFTIEVGVVPPAK